MRDDGVTCSYLRAGLLLRRAHLGMHPRELKLCIGIKVLLTLQTSRRCV